MGCDVSAVVVVVVVAGEEAGEEADAVAPDQRVVLWG